MAAEKVDLKTRQNESAAKAIGIIALIRINYPAYRRWLEQSAILVIFGNLVHINCDDKSNYEHWSGIAGDSR